MTGKWCAHCVLMAVDSSPWSWTALRRKRFCQRDNRCGIPVDETPTVERAREFWRRISRHRRGEAARTLFIEVEAEGVGAEFDGEAGVFEAGDAEILTRVIGCFSWR